jgi:hypothetical protein
MCSKRQVSTALPVGFAVDLEEELSRGTNNPEGVIGPNEGGDVKGQNAEQEALIAEEARALDAAAAGNKSQSVTLADFDVLRVIGKGSFGKVFLVQKKGSGGEYMS